MRLNATTSKESISIFFHSTNSVVPQAANLNYIVDSGENRTDNKNDETKSNFRHSIT